VNQAATATATTIEVVRPGVLATVQDLGRPGLGRFGVSPSGAMDPLALRMANRLLGNPAGAPALELTGPGAELRFLHDAPYALAGADLGATLDGAPAPLHQAARAPAGAVLRFARRARGARATLALAGGIEVAPVLGSAATDLDAGLGGGALGRGARLAAGAADPPAVSSPWRPSPALLALAYDDPFLLRYLPHADPALGGGAAAVFASASWKVTERSNRTGYRLAGPAPLPLSAGRAADRLSEPLAPGTLQVPPDGQPIMLMADRQTVGGYPILGHLAAADRTRAAQLWPGDMVRFRAVSLDEAHAAARALAAAFEEGP
jgi:5-oxoprolinase (ATP-hydrolysing) subunit C